MDNRSNSKICFADFEIDTARRLLWRNGETVALNPKAFDVLAFLAANPGRVVSKNEILDTVWEDHFVEEANLKVQISALRKVLGEGKNDHRFLVTVPGKGYKFVGKVTNGNGEVVIERHRFSQTTYQQEAEINTRPQDKTLWTRYALGAFVVFAGGLAVAGAYLYLSPKPASAPFQKVSLKRLTNSGKVAASAVSPDGKNFAYVLGDAEGNSLWVQQTGTASQIRLLPPTKAEFWDLTFSPDGKFIYYDLFYADKSDTELYRIPALGGVVEKIPNVVTRSISFSPDGKRFAFISPDSDSNHNYLSIADADGGNARIIAKKPHPNTFVYDGRFVAWSPDGETIATVVNNLGGDANYASIVLVNADDGSERPLGSYRWSSVGSISWNKDDGLLVTGGDKASSRNQVWLVSYPDAERKQITNDLSSYQWVSPTSAGDSLAAIQNTTTSGIYVGQAGTNDFKEIVSEVGGLSPLVWNGDKIVFRSVADGKSNLSSINPDGTDRRQLTVEADVSERGMAASPDGRYLVFVSWRSGKSNLWRVNSDGSDLTQLTDGEADAYPRIMADGVTIVFQRGILTQPTLWTVPIVGGEPSRLTDFRAKWEAASGDGKYVSFFHMMDDKWRIGFIDPKGSLARQGIDVPSNLRESTTYWTQDSNNLLFVGAVGSVGNLWSLPLDGSRPKPITQFTSHSMNDFAPSRDGRIAVVRSLSLSDVVLIESAPE